MRPDHDLRELLADHFHCSGVPQAFLRCDGAIQEANESFCELFGYSREELLGTWADDLLDRLEPQRFAARAAFKDTADTEGIGDTAGVDRLHVDVVGRDAQGHRIPLLIDLARVRDVSGRPRGFGLVVKDLTDLRETQRRASGQEAFFQALNRRASDLALVSDAEGQIVYVSPSVTELLGYLPDEVALASGYSFVHDDDQHAAHALVERALTDPARPARAVLRIKDSSGRWRHFEETITNCLADPDIGGLVANLRDITESVEAQQALEESERRYRAIAETALEGLVVVSVEDGATLFANARLADIVGVHLEDVYRYGILSVLTPDQAAAIHANALRRDSIGPERYDLEIMRPDGEVRILQISASPLSEARGSASLAMVADVTAERHAARQLRRAALHDPLTGLPNRALLADRIEMAVADQQRNPERGLVTVMFLDVDRLKSINDSAGHATGDAVLVEVADRLRSAVRGTDTVARLGGDEFVVLCRADSEEHAEQIAARIRSTLAAPVVVNSRAFTVTASIGVATSPPRDPADLLRSADVAMYQAKERSSGGVLMYDELLADSARRRADLVAGVRTALDTGQLAVHYQPIIDLSTAQVQGLEALVRWAHPHHGPVPPLELLVAAKEAGRAIQLDHLVLHRACSDLAVLIREGLLTDRAYVSVNLDAATVSAEPLSTSVTAAVSNAGIAPGNLVLEITESSLMTDVTKAVERLRTLSQHGVRIAIDDFGTGYSSLAYLQQLPIHILKVDRSFVAGLTDDPASELIVRAILGLAGGLGLDVVAEGIESFDDLQLLKGLGCSSGQGFHWTPARHLDDLHDYLREVTDRGRVTPAVGD